MTRKFLINKNLSISNRINTQYIQESFLSFDPDIILKSIQMGNNDKLNIENYLIISGNEIKIQQSTYNDLLKNIQGRTLEIVKRIYLINNVQLELDSYKDFGIKILLINDEIDKPILPPILDKEITNDDFYKHKNMVIR